MQIRAKPFERFSTNFPPNEFAPGMLDQLHVYHDTAFRSAALNMALDEALLEISATPALRFYGWERPSLSFGYFGRLEDAIQIGAERELVRRWTGGGMVLHGEDLTYSLVLPLTHNCLARSPRKIYGDIHAAMRDVLVHDGVAARLAMSAPPKISEACFANPVFADVLVDNEKIAGAAQRRTRAGLLQQGSVQYPRLPVDFAQRVALALCSSAETRALDKRIIERAEAIAAQKYATARWLHLR